MNEVAANGKAYGTEQQQINGNAGRQGAGKTRSGRPSVKAAKPGKFAKALAAVLAPYAKALGGAAPLTLSTHTCCCNHCARVADHPNVIEGVVLPAGAHSYGKKGWEVWR